MKLHDVGARNDVPGLHTDYRRVTENPDIDVVSIASPDDQHAEHAISAIQSRQARDGRKACRADPR